MRKEIQIKTNDNYTIYGELDSQTKSNTLIIIVHGLTGGKNQYHYLNAVPFFNSKGYDSFRFDFYSRKPDSRSLTITSISTHADDLKTIIDNFKNDYKNIILIGHSLGALAILSTDLSSISKIILWDPTTPIKDIESKKISFNKNINKFILHWGQEVLTSVEMMEEWKSYDLDKSLTNLQIPCKIIFAGNYNKHEVWAPYLNKFKFENIIIAGATHDFIEEGVLDKLLEATYKMIRD